jgi:hypothetical protein
MLRSWLALAVALHVVFATFYAWCTPSFEGPDENSHYEYAWQLGNARRLPLAAPLAAARQLPQTEGAVLAHHPPLYYAILGTALAATGTDDTVFGPLLNPDFGAPDRASRHLKFQHGSGQGEGVLFGLRLVSGLLGAITVWLVHRLGRACCPQQPRVADLAALLVACLPMFSFLHGVLNSDVLATTLATATVLALVTWPPAERTTVRHALALGTLLALALLTKLTALFLLPLTAAVVTAAWRARERAAVGATLRPFGVATLVGLALAGWSFVRNASLYGDPLAMSAHDAAFPSLDPALRWPIFVDVFLPNIFTSLLGCFGWFSLPPHPLLVWTGAAVAALALVGVVRAAIDRERTYVPQPGWLLLLAMVLVFAGTAHFNWKVPQPQGRLLFPAIGPAAVLLAAGLVRISRGWPGRRWLAVLLPLTAGVVAVAYFRPAFDPSLAPAPAWQRALVGRITGDGTPGITWREPLPANPLPAGAPLPLRWTDAGAPPDTRYSLYAFDTAGRVWLASHEWSQGKVVMQRGEAELPAALLDFLPKNTDVLLKLRRVPSTPTEDPATLPSSPSLRVRRD